MNSHKKVLLTHLFQSYFFLIIKLYLHLVCTAAVAVILIYKWCTQTESEVSLYMPQTAGQEVFDPINYISGFSRPASGYSEPSPHPGLFTKHSGLVYLCCSARGWAHVQLPVTMDSLLGRLPRPNPDATQWPYWGYTVIRQDQHYKFHWFDNIPYHAKSKYCCIYICVCVKCKKLWVISISRERFWT